MLVEKSALNGLWISDISFFHHKNGSIIRNLRNQDVEKTIDYGLDSRVQVKRIQFLYFSLPVVDTIFKSKIQERKLKVKWIVKELWNQSNITYL